MAQHHCRAVEGSGQVEGEVCWNSKKIELIYMFLFKVIESVPEPFMETCFCSKKLLGRFTQSSWDLEQAPDAFVGVFAPTGYNGELHPAAKETTSCVPGHLLV